MHSMKKRLLAGALALAGTTSVVLIAVGSAQAAEPSLEPEVKAYDSEFYTQEQMGDVWLSVTKSWPSPLPTGYAFSSELPVDFVPEVPANDIYQIGLPEIVAARQWRCAWIDVALNSGDPAASKEAESQLLGYEKLPYVAENVEVAKYETQMAEYAKTVEMTPLQAEFEIDCAGTAVTKEAK